MSEHIDTWHQPTVRAFNSSVKNSPLLVPAAAIALFMANVRDERMPLSPLNASAVASEIDQDTHQKITKLIQEGNTDQAGFVQLAGGK